MYLSKFGNYGGSISAKNTDNGIELTITTQAFGEVSSNVVILSDVEAVNGLIRELQNVVMLASKAVVKDSNGQVIGRQG